MPQTVLKTKQLDVADREQLMLDVTGDGSYTTGGYDFLPANCGFRSGGLSIDYVEGKAPSGRSLRYSKATNKLLWIEPNGTEVANAVDLSAEVARALVIGR